MISLCFVDDKDTAVLLEAKGANIHEKDKEGNTGISTYIPYLPNDAWISLFSLKQLGDEMVPELGDCVLEKELRNLSEMAPWFMCVVGMRRIVSMMWAEGLVITIIR